MTFSPRSFLVMAFAFLACSLIAPLTIQAATTDVQAVGIKETVVDSKTSDGATKDSKTSDGKVLPQAVREANKKTVESTKESSAGGFMRTILGLGFIIALVYGLKWLVKRKGGFGSVLAASDVLKLEASLALGPGRAIHVVRVGEDFMLIGASEHAITRLGRIDQVTTQRLERDIQSAAVDSVPVISSPPTLIERLRMITSR